MDVMIIGQWEVLIRELPDSRRNEVKERIQKKDILCWHLLCNYCFDMSCYILYLFSFLKIL